MGTEAKDLSGENSLSSETTSLINVNVYRHNLTPISSKCVCLPCQEEEEEEEESRFVINPAATATTSPQQQLLVKNNHGGSMAKSTIV